MGKMTEELFLFFPTKPGNLLYQLDLRDRLVLQGGIQPVAEQAIKIFVGMLEQLEGFTEIAAASIGNRLSLVGRAGLFCKECLFDIPGFKSRDTDQLAS